MDQSAICTGTDLTARLLLRSLVRLPPSVSLCLSFTSPLSDFLHFALVEHDPSICPSPCPPPGLGIHAACAAAAAKGERKRRGKQEREGGREKKPVGCRRQTADDIERRYAEVKLSAQETAIISTGLI